MGGGVASAPATKKLGICRGWPKLISNSMKMKGGEIRVTLGPLSCFRILVLATRLDILLPFLTCFAIGPLEGFPSFVYH